MSPSAYPGRRPDWRERLAHLFAQRACDAFAWGRNDCTIFAADAVQALTGADPAAHLRGTYGCAIAARRAARQHLAALLCASCGAPPAATPTHLQDILRALCDLLLPRCAPLLAQPGDIALVRAGDTGAALAVCGGAAWHAPVLAQHGGGLAALPIDAALCAWAVGWTPPPAAQAGASPAVATSTPAAAAA
jgi:hypothetical protein